MAGAAATIVTHPLDMIKTRLALTHHGVSTRRPEYANAFDAARRIFADEGIQRGIYRGLGISLLGSSLYWGIAFACLWRVEQLPWTRKVPFIPYEWYLWACAAVTTATIVTHPIDVIRRKHMASNSSMSIDRNLVDVIRNIKRQYGISGYYRGLLANTMYKVSDDVFCSYKHIFIFIDSNTNWYLLYCV